MHARLPKPTLYGRCGHRLRAVLSAVIVVLAILAGQAAAAQQPAIYTSEHDDLALGGYDPVSYATDMPVAGIPKWSARYKSAVWRFASQANRAAFVADPDRYMPAYGGHCAWTMASGAFVRGLPSAWIRRGGRLYLFYDDRTARFWEENPDRHIQFADINYAERAALAAAGEVPDIFEGTDTRPKFTLD